MCILRKKHKNTTEIELFGLHFANPLGIVMEVEALSGRFFRRFPAGFLSLTPPKEHILEWIHRLQEIRNKTVVAINIKEDILRTFSLVYDFADFIIIDPDNDNGIDSPDIADIAQLLDEIVNLRLCYEHYTPILLRISREDTPDEIRPLCACARLSGLDGIVAPDAKKVQLTLAECDHRLPVLGVAQTQEEVLASLAAGACLVETRSFRPRAFEKLQQSIENQTIQNT